MYTYIYTISIYALHRLSQLDKLQVLDLSYNPLLREVPEAVYSLSQLTVLNLAGCNLSNISERYVYDDNTLQNLILYSISHVYVNYLHYFTFLQSNVIAFRHAAGYLQP